MQVPVYRRPKVAIAATGSELIDPSEVPSAGKIRNSNSLAIAACAKAAGCIPTILPIVEDTYEALEKTVLDAVETYDFVVTTGGAANGDFDFIKPVVEGTGELLMTTVNMRPGKAQTFGLVKGKPVFGLPGNPAAAYCGFEMIVRQALRKMQGYSHFNRPGRSRTFVPGHQEEGSAPHFFARDAHERRRRLSGHPRAESELGAFRADPAQQLHADMPEGLGVSRSRFDDRLLLLDVSDEVLI